MFSDNQTPEITTFLRKFTFIEAAVLFVAGFGLFFFPQLLGPLWAWEIAPFNARFLAGIYIGALVPISLMYSSGRWSPTRLVLRAITVFTFTVLVVSVYHLDRFDFSLPGVWVWFALYIALPASGGYHLWLYRSMDTDHLISVTSRWRITLVVSSLMFAIYGLGLILAPEYFASLFPWKLDAFHSQLYSATFLTGAVMMASVAKATTPTEFIAAGLTEATFSAFAILGLIIVDSKVHKIDWMAANTVAWLSLLSIIFLLGAAMSIEGARLNRMG